MSGSLVFKSSAVYDLALMVTDPWKDYIPIKIGLEDLEEKLGWVKQRDRQAREIARRGQLKMLKYFSYESLQCYTIHLLRAYHKLLI